MNYLLIQIYLLATLLSIYMPLKTVMLSISAGVSFCLMLFSILEIKNSKKIDKYIFFIIIAIITSALTNNQYLYPLLNISTILAVYYIMKKYPEYTIKSLYVYIVVFNIINCMLYLFLPPDYIGIKHIGSIRIMRIQLNIIPLSITSVIAILNFYISSEIESKFKRIIVKIVSIILIFKLGKISILGALFVIQIITPVLQYRLSKIKFKIYTAIFNILYTMLCFISFIVVFNRNFLNTTITRLLTMRDIIWNDYITYILGSEKFIFGIGFIPKDTEISYISNTHNQFLMIIVILGFFGGIIFLSFLLQIFNNTFKDLLNGKNLNFKIFNTLFLLMLTDSYYLLTVFPLYLIFFVYFSLKIVNKEPNQEEIER